MIDVYWPFWLGGVAIASVASLMVVLTGQFLGITRGYASFCAIFSKRPYFHQKEFGGAFGVRSIFTVGVVIGGFVAALINGGWHPSLSYGSFDKIYGTSILVKALVLVIGGCIWGYGARMAKGCTSGNSISGLSKGSLASLVTTLGFMISGIGATYIINFLAGTL